MTSIDYFVFFLNISIKLFEYFLLFKFTRNNKNQYILQFIQQNLEQ